MHRFQPTRASPPIKEPPSSNCGASEPGQEFVAPELQNLSPDDIDILDAVIQRAGSAATTFFTIFKAYSDVLQERGLDPQEVIYYGKLLKLGTLKGRNWGEKWGMVKAQAEWNPYNRPNLTPESLRSESDVQPLLPNPKRQTTRKSQAIIQQRREEIPRPLLRSEGGRLSREKAAAQMKCLSDTKDIPILSSIADRGDSTKFSPTFGTNDDEESSSPVPPSYKSTILDATLIIPPQRRGAGLPKLSDPAPFLRKVLAVPKEPRKVVNLDDAWKNIQLEQDEKVADKFREDMLVARCWEIWRQGFIWITTTHQQIGEARDNLLVKLSMQRWQNSLVARQKLEGDFLQEFSKRYVKLALKKWQTKLKHKRQTAWRQDMRQRMKVIKAKSELRILKGAWAKWQQLHLSHRADVYYQQLLVSRYLSQWKGRLVTLDNMDSVADDFASVVYSRTLAKSWLNWKQITSLRRDEHIMVQRIECRITANAFDLWRMRIEQIRIADTFKDKWTMKHAVCAWIKAIGTLRGLDRRLEKFLVCREDFLLRAVIRIWRARMRGKRLENFRLSLLLRDSWQSWRNRIGNYNAQRDVAVVFSNRTNSRLISGTLVRWREVLSTHQNAYNYAITYNETHLQARMLLLWRLRLRDALQSAKVARWANKFFATRRSWNLWLAAVDERKRQERLKLWVDAKVRNLFNDWKRRAIKQKYFKQCEAVIRVSIEKRILLNSLACWTNRVIEVKSRELDIAHRYDMSLMRAALHKWQACRRQHFEEASLLENYLLVKREDVIRRAFHKWLTAKRAAEHRRLTHQRKEAHLRQVAITFAWEKWRERFKDERLRPLEYQVILENQKNVLLHSITMWIAKTESLPAVRFHSTQLKKKFFKKWRNAMPNALRTRRARETDRKNTLANAFEKWTQAFQTKITLKAVARAKYLRLPPASRRQPLIRSLSRRPGSNEDFPRRYLQASGPDEHSKELTPSLQPLIRPCIPERDFTQPKIALSEQSATRSEYAPSVARQSSPVRSIVSMPDRRSKSPHFSRVPTSPSDAGIEGGRLWSAIKDLKQPRRPRNL